MNATNNENEPCVNPMLQDRGRGTSPDATGSKDSGSITRDDNAIQRQKPFDEPLSHEFFDSLKENDVLKCLNYLKKNPKLAQDCDNERRTPLHWACNMDQTNMV